MGVHVRVGACISRGGIESGDCETLATTESVRVVSAYGALAACECLAKEGLRCCGVSLE